MASLYHPQVFTSPEACGFGSKAQGGGNHSGHRLTGIDKVAGGHGSVLGDEGEGRREVENAGEVGGMTNEVGFGAGGACVGTAP